ncbi:DUF4157 domain-containing protein [Janthinobacterium fluminis]|uniref:DUF4157 domain-containing protein n=1 Tax=Janthinobacterium fluminis TaxID=2987524 RepID=A0ABT5JX05_9BURK|nr:DUF4157 domain-containing protein [Janthinobacterium fluminis]MDC8757011.1 DUF4157 domain-containing protein [Janthinobacterium fluminis]
MSGLARQRQVAPAGAATASALAPASALLQRKCACGGQTIGGASCDACAARKRQLQRHATGGAAGPAAIPPIVDEVLRAPGRPLDRATLAYMEPRLGSAFSHVRVHTDAGAARSAQAIDAHAYTVGRDVVFGAGKYAPETADGKRLLAHELTHVVQQGRGTGMPAGMNGGARADSFEREADAAGAGIADARPLAGAAPRAPGGSIYSRHIQRAAIHDGNILFEGSCAFLACLGGSCPDEENGVACAGQKTRKAGDGKKYRPLFTCDKECDKGKTCDDNDDWMAIPNGRFAYRKCAQSLVVCANGGHTSGTVRDKSEIEAWEVSPGIQSKLGVSGKFKGVIYPSTDDKQFKKDSRCHPKKSALDSEMAPAEGPEMATEDETASGEELV